MLELSLAFLVVWAALGVLSLQFRIIPALNRIAQAQEAGATSINDEPKMFGGEASCVSEATDIANEAVAEWRKENPHLTIEATETTVTIGYDPSLKEPLIAVVMTVIYRDGAQPSNTGA